MVPIHLIVPNLHILLSHIPPGTQWYSVLDLKDALFCIPTHSDSQFLFAFEWSDPDTKHTQQLTWKCYPRSSETATTYLTKHEQKPSYLYDWKAKAACSHMYNLLICSPDRQTSDNNTVLVLKHLAERGYQVSPTKAQITSQQVTFLGLILTPGRRSISPHRRTLILDMALPATKQQLRTFLGMAGLCWIWIPTYGLLAQPLYEALKGPENLPLEWTTEMETAFRQMKEALVTAPALGLPDLAKPFSLFTHKRRGITLGALTPSLGPSQRPVAYLSKTLDATSQGWPPCLRALAATALLTEEASKLTMGQPLTVYTPHQVLGVLNSKAYHWVSDNRIQKYQALFLERSETSIKPCNILNPATFSA